jgi:hypothetical protein
LKRLRQVQQEYEANKLSENLLKQAETEEVK